MHQQTRVDSIAFTNHVIHEVYNYNSKHSTKQQQQKRHISSQIFDVCNRLFCWMLQRITHSTYSCTYTYLCVYAQNWNKFAKRIQLAVILFVSCFTCALLCARPNAHTHINTTQCIATRHRSYLYIILSD